MAGAGPLFITVIRYERLTPTCPGLGDADLPTARSTLAGLITLSVTDAVCIVVPAVPVILIVLSPNGVVPLVPIVSVEVLANASVILTEVGLKLAFAPAGNPVALKFTVPVNPANGVIVIEY